MKPKEFTVNELFSGAQRYRVPLYQRHYVWDKRNWKHLWTDIEEKSNLRSKSSAKEHFAGAIVIQEDARNKEIIDGQQRLTTFQIILCAIRDICETFDSDISSIAQGSQELIQNPKSSVSVPDEQYKLLPREGFDRAAFQPLIIPDKVAMKEENQRQIHSRSL